MTPRVVVEAVRADFANPLYPARSAAFLLALCARLRAEFPHDAMPGLRRKDAGMGIDLPSGDRVALDIIMYPDGTAYDCLASAEEGADPVWNQIDDLPTYLYVPVLAAAPEPSENLRARVEALEQAVRNLTALAVKHSDTVSLYTAHGRPVRAGDAGTQYRLDQAEVLGPWERFIIRREED